MDWAAAILELVGVWIIGNQCRWGFIICLACNACWIWAALKLGMYGLVVASTLMGGVNIRNFIHWRRNEQKSISPIRPEV